MSSSSSVSRLSIDSFSWDIVEAAATSVFGVDNVPFCSSSDTQKNKDKEFMMEIFKARSFKDKTGTPNTDDNMRLLKHEMIDLDNGDDLRSLLVGTWAAMRASIGDNINRTEDGPAVDKAKLLGSIGGGFPGETSVLSMLSDASWKDALVSKLRPFFVPPPPESEQDFSSLSPMNRGVLASIQTMRFLPHQAMFTDAGKAGLVESMTRLASNIMPGFNAALGDTRRDQFASVQTDENAMRAMGVQMLASDQPATHQMFTILENTINKGIDEGILRKEAFADLSERVDEIITGFASLTVSSA